MTHRRRVILTVAAVAAGLAMVVSPFVLFERGTAAVSDTEMLGPNHLAAATLDVAVGRGTASFAVTDMAPGDRAYGFVELVNDGDLPLAAELSTSSPGDVLSSELELTVWPSAARCASPAGPGAVGVVRVTGLGSPSGTTVVGDPAPGVQSQLALDPGQSRSWCVEVHLPLEADNALQGDTTTQEMVVDAIHLVDPDSLEPLVPED